MKAKRRRHDPEFKARVALEALKGIKTIQQIAKDFDIHPVQVSEWKKTMAEGAAGVFGPGAGKTEAGQEGAVEPLAEWEQELLAGATSSPAADSTAAAEPTTDAS